MMSKRGWPNRSLKSIRDGHKTILTQVSQIYLFFIFLLPMWVEFEPGWAPRIMFICANCSVNHCFHFLEDESDAHKGQPPQKAGRRKPRQNRNVPRGQNHNVPHGQNHNVPRGQNHNRGGAFHSNYHTRPPFPPDYMFPPPEPHMFPFQGPMMPPFPRPPPFHMRMAPWPPGPNQGFMFQPPPPPPPPPHNQ